MPVLKTNYMTEKAAHSLHAGISSIGKDEEPQV